MPVCGREGVAQSSCVLLDPKLLLVGVAPVAVLLPFAARIYEILKPLAPAGEGRHVRYHLAEGGSPGHVSGSSSSLGLAQYGQIIHPPTQGGLPHVHCHGDS